MQIISNPDKDSATPSKPPGGYEWWYFDAIDETTGYALVVIFYQGNPFSNRYIRQLMDNDRSEKAKPCRFPAVSISLYKNQEPVFYSFTEYPESQAEFNSDAARVSVGPNTFEAEVSGSEMKYSLSLNEELPSGDKLNADLSFSRMTLAVDFREENENNGEGHIWNLVMPRADVEGSLRVFRDTAVTHTVGFKGLGYHDHNTGFEPMKDEFRDWYWGRYHFKSATLVYYVMNMQDSQQYRGWLIGNERGEILNRFENIELKDETRSIFGLKIARKLMLGNGSIRAVIQQSHSLDNGPFYCRFKSEAFLSLEERVERSTGFSEYIHPSRIYWRFLWPLVDMRIRYKKEEPHWVQKSGRLYRWTW